MNDPWYKKAFGSFYLEVYRHRDKGEAESGLDLLERLADLPGARVLDLACGAGRHLTALAERRADPVGIDLSAELLAHARKEGSVVRGDMRFLPFGDRSFHGVVNMFTSFGYFPDREENLSVFREVARLLRPGGWFLFDYLNRDPVLDSLVAQSERRVGGQMVREERNYDSDSRILSKRVEILDDSVPVREWEERLFLFTPSEIEEGMSRAGLEVRNKYGDYGGGEFRDDSRRLIVYSLRKMNGAAD